MPVGGEIFRNRPDLPWGPLSLLYNGCLVFPGRYRRPRRGADPPPHLVPKFLERVELYLYLALRDFVAYKKSETHLPIYRNVATV